MIEFNEIKSRVNNKIQEITAYLVDLRKENTDLKIRIKELERPYNNDRELMLKNEIFMV